MIKPLVVDLYHEDAVTDFKLAAADGIAGVIHKASTGATGKDDLYGARKIAAANAGLLWGAYHWGTAADVDSQIAKFLSVINPAPNPISALDGMLIALDFEVTTLDDGSDDTMTLAQAKDFLAKLTKIIGRRPVLYAGGHLKDALNGKADPELAAYRLWLADYEDKPTLPPGWTSAWLWQYSGDGQGPDTKTVKGIPGDAKGTVDCSTFARGVAVLKAEWAT